MLGTQAATLAHLRWPTLAGHQPLLLQLLTREEGHRRRPSVGYRAHQQDAWSFR